MLELLRNTTAPTIARMPWENIEEGFMRDQGGQILFLSARGRWTLAFPVLADGTILRHGTSLPGRGEIVDMVHPHDLGITKICWAQRLPDNLAALLTL